MRVYTSHKKGFERGDLVTHNRIGTLGVIVEIFSLDNEDFAEISYYSGVVRIENIDDLLPTREALRDEVR
jgi:hypothetical protein|tara:strand:- start:273 stop:482 length:210 start_codon:yes stop_codon:yes gene_type:complete